MPKRKNHRVHTDEFADIPRAPQPKPPEERSPEPISPLTDWYIGRFIFKSSGLVGTIEDQFPQTELITYDGSLVVPLMKRHRAHGEREAILIASLRKLNERLPSTRDTVDIATMGHTIGYSQANTPVVRVNLDKTAPAFNALVHEGRTLKSISPIFRDSFAVNPRIRIADTPDSEVALAILGLCREFPLPPTLTLSPAMVCDAPAKCRI